MTVEQKQGTSELLACPFCGAEPRLRNPHEVLWIVDCGECGAQASSETDVRDYAIAAWNRRTPPAAGQSVSADVVAEVRSGHLCWAIGGDDPRYMTGNYELYARPPPPAAAEGKGEWMPVTEEQTEAILDAYQEAATAARYHGLSEAVARMRDAINSVLCPPASAGDG